jgi:hypothetical protein
VAEQREGDLDEVVAGAGLVEQRAEQHEQEDELVETPERDAEHAFGGDPLVIDHVEGKAAKARNSAKARWIDRASVSLNTPKPSMNGIGEANQSWNSDQDSATSMSAVSTPPERMRPPVSAEATSSSSSAWLSPSLAPA